MANKFSGHPKRKKGGPMGHVSILGATSGQISAHTREKKEVPWAICPFWVPQVLQVSLQVSLVDG